MEAVRKFDVRRWTIKGNNCDFLRLQVVIVVYDYVNRRENK
jgi:hypothetical protein